MHLTLKIIFQMTWLTEQFQERIETMTYSSGVYIHTERAQELPHQQ